METFLMSAHPNNGRAWTQRDDRYIRSAQARAIRLKNQGREQRGLWIALARYLGRSVIALRKRASTLRLLPSGTTPR
jgi:hypothetical protein